MASGADHVVYRVDHAPYLEALAPNAKMREPVAMRNVALQQIVYSRPVKRRARKETVLSRQLAISSLFSTFALVMLALFARAGDIGAAADMQVENAGPLMVISASAQ